MDPGKEKHRKEFLTCFPAGDSYRSEPISDDESSEEEFLFDDTDVSDISYDLDDPTPNCSDFELKANYQNDLAMLMDMIRTNGPSNHPVAVKSCAAIHTFSDNMPGPSVRSVLSNAESSAKENLALQGKLYKFNNPQYGHVALKRCASDISLNINRPKTVVFFENSSDSESLKSLPFYMMENRIGETSYLNIDTEFDTSMNDLSELFAAMHISTQTSPRRVRKIFNLKTWGNAIYVERGRNTQAKILPIEMAWKFIEFRPQRSAPRKRFADWYTTDTTPAEKMRK